MGVSTTDLRVVASETNYGFTLPQVRAADVWKVQQDKRQSTPLRRIYDHELVYVVSGSALISLEDNVYVAPTDSLFLIQPGVWHSFRSATESNVALLGVHFDWTKEPAELSFIECVRLFSDSVPNDALWRRPQTVTGWNVKDRPLLRLNGRPRVRQILEQVVASFALATTGSDAQCGAFLAAAIFQIELEASLQCDSWSNTELGPGTMRRLQEARNLLETPDGHNKYRSVDEVASSIGWSPDHLRRVFRLALGTSPNEVQMTARIHRAQSLLKATVPIQEVAYRCGFADPAYFSRVFKKHCGGRSPRQYVNSEAVSESRNLQDMRPR